MRLLINWEWNWGLHRPEPGGEWPRRGSRLCLPSLSPVPSLRPQSSPRALRGPLSAPVTACALGLRAHTLGPCPCLRPDLQGVMLKLPEGHPSAPHSPPPQSFCCRASCTMAPTRTPWSAPAGPPSDLCSQIIPHFPRELWLVVGQWTLSIVAWFNLCCNVSISACFSSLVSWIGSQKAWHPTWPHWLELGSKLLS